MLFNTAWEQHTPDPIGKILSDAADAIEQHGHVKGVLRERRDSGGMCLMGAIAYASTGKAFYIQHSIAIEAVQRMGFCDCYDAVTWNNDTHTRPQEVIDRLRAAAKLPADA